MNLLQKLSLLSLAASLPLCAQQTYTAKAIVFKHRGDLPQAQLERVSGFHPGLTFTTATLSAAAQKLADTGYFDNIGATLDGSVASTTVLFDLTPSAPASFLPTGFENFVWLTPEEIDSAIRSKVPLYIGTLPEAGTQADAAADALTAALAAKGIQAKVTHDTIEPTLDHPLRSIEFSVTDPVVVVSNSKLAGVSPALVPLVQASAQKTAGTLYNAGLNGRLTAEGILSSLKDAGYARATLTGVSAETSAIANDKEPVVVHATLDAGDVYHVSAINFAGTPLFSADDFAKAQSLKPGDVASRKQLLATLRPIDDAYRNKGYLDVIVKADPTFDTEAKTVSYSISVTPGDAYKLHQVTADGLDPAAKADFDRYFLIKPGDIYNPGYVAGFIKNNTALQSLAHYRGTFKAYASPTTHTVDLYLTFGGSANRTTITVR